MDLRLRAPSLEELGKKSKLEWNILPSFELKRPERLGLMLVGWGGNNGTTLTASILANKLGLRWESRRGTECRGTQAVNPLQRQRRAIESLLRICAGLPLQDDLNLQSRI